MASTSVPAAEVEKLNPTKEPNWLELPRDVTLNILQRLGTVEIITSACLVCPSWWNICKDPYIWRTIHVSKFGYPRYSLVDLEKMCRLAVQRSCGQLEDIYIDFIGTDELLEYIADRNLSDIGFIGAVKKLPLLEELYVSENYKLSRFFYVAAGLCCPFLKSLSYGRMVSVEGFIEVDDEAFVIAKTMPGLRSLKIDGDVLTSDGIVAILNGCPLLESLDMALYYSMELEESFNESLRKRCCEQIKKCILPMFLQPCTFLKNDSHCDTSSEDFDGSDDGSNLEYYLGQFLSLDEN
ncbi:putative F-box/LRR-repeat protein 23 [Vicia villosa]|uniref:putative F-box/LRR-repeat protein 23 n=1 Tax=Vicia villosa TaxID=3911 RepID=UPI00273CA274|nr:putative F-box/LRR-repeat protein 23 [Vicia villosa]